MRVRLGTKGGFILPTSLVDLAATAVRILMWELHAPTSMRARACCESITAVDKLARIARRGTLGNVERLMLAPHVVEYVAPPD